MRRVRTLVLAGILLTFGWTTQASAKECKTKPVTAEGKMTLTKIRAYPDSLFAWRRAVKDEHGAAYQAWRRAADREINCVRVKNDAGKKRWQCTRVARPCARDGQGDNYVEAPEYPGYALRRGDEGKDVETLQRLLVEAGYEVEVDGDFGRNTRKAVRTFQKTEAISIDGVVGRETWKRLVS
ncbi:MAG: peptidoglycan-binding domain-containing protein [Hyphomicrobiaceae bacterium]